MQLRNSLVKLTVCCFVAAGVSLTVCADEPRPDTITAIEILQRMSKAYSGCRSYRDSGVVKTTFFGRNRNWTDEKPFRTAFIRPDRFRYEFTEKMHDIGIRHRYIIWQNGKEIETWWDIKPGVEKPGSLGLALAAATGVSGGSAYIVPSLLLPAETKGSLLARMMGAKRDDDVVFEWRKLLQDRGNARHRSRRCLDREEELSPTAD